MSHFISKLLEHRRLWAAALVLVILFMAVPQPANAWLGIPGPAELISGIIFAVVQFLSMVAGVIIAIQAWFLEIILNISVGLVNSAPVRVGFPIVLSIANLFFVGALIVIAIATILRRAEYGAKKVLWKLVVMAVMVNFGLVICGALLSLSDETTKFFIESISPASSGPGGETNFKGFANSIAGAFNPQAVVLSSKDLTNNPAVSTEAIGKAATAGSDFGAILKPFISIISTLGTFVIIIITLATLNSMLMWRYIKLGLALIVLPLAWAAWIFPTYQEHYKKWWTNFTKWTIFPPVVVFFIWLGLKVSEVMSQQTGEFKTIYPTEGGNVVADFLDTLITPIVGQTLKAFILFGIMMGGMVAAQELGIKGAEGAVKAIEGVGKGAKGYAGRKMNRGGALVKEGVSRGAMKGGAKVAARLEKMGMPFMNKKKVIDDQGKVQKEDKTPEEKLSGILNKKADQNRDNLQEKLEPGSSLEQWKGENLGQWQERLGKRGLGPKVTPAESDADWNKRFDEGAAKAALTDSSLQQRFADGETEEDWKARVSGARPDLARRGATAESSGDWKKRIDETRDKLAKAAKAGGGFGDDKGLVSSMWDGMNEGFKKGGHPKLTTERRDELLKELGVDHATDTPHSPAPSAPPAPSSGGEAPKPAGH